MTHLYSVYAREWNGREVGPVTRLRTTSYEKALETLGNLLAVDPPSGAVKTRVELTLEVELLDG